MIDRLKTSLTGLAVWWVLLLPFDYVLFDWFFRSVRFPFQFALTRFDKDLLFETDTYGTYLLISLSISLGIVSGFGVKWLGKKIQLSSTELLKTVLAAILFFFLVKYGWNKITKSQFYLPEPNTLYTPMGQLSKDIAYWSLMGSSYSYTFFLGIFEVLVAFLLIFNRTQFLASVLAIGVFAQIFLVNCSFDISVKLLSGSLLFFSLVYSACFLQNWKAMLGFPGRVFFLRNSEKHRAVKCGFVVLVVLECMAPTFVSGNLNDDRFARIHHHGAYSVEGSPTLQRIYIHRHGYLIAERSDGSFIDYKMSLVSKDRYETVIGNISCDWKNNQLTEGSDTFRLIPVPYKELPLLKSDFHVFSDAFH